MSFSDKLAVHLSPVLIRLVLGGTFALAGAAKIFSTTEVTPLQAARLAELGILSPTAAGAPSQALPPSEGEPEAEDSAGENVGRRADARPAIVPVVWQDGGEQPEAEQPEAEQPEADEAASGEPETDAEAAGAAGDAAEDAPVEGAIDAATDNRFTAADFPNGAEVRRLHASITLTLLSATKPDTYDKDGNPAKPYMPSLPVGLPMLAWAAAVTELVAGGLLLIGFFGRFAGLAVAIVMGTAAWLVEIGPEWQAGTLVYGFLPGRPWDDVSAWMHLLWQLALLSMGVGIFFSGAGTLSVDRLLWGGGGDGDDDDD